MVEAACAQPGILRVRWIQEASAGGRSAPVPATQVSPPLVATECVQNAEFLPPRSALPVRALARSPSPAAEVALRRTSAGGRFVSHAPMRVVLMPKLRQRVESAVRSHGRSRIQRCHGVGRTEAAVLGGDAEKPTGNNTFRGNSRGAAEVPHLTWRWRWSSVMARRGRSDNG